MDTEDLQAWCRQLRQELCVGKTTKRSKKWRCPAELRSRVVSFTKACRERGEPYLDIAVRLGLVESTLTRWLRTDRVKEHPGFRSVSIVPAGGGESDPPLDPPSLRLLTPQGYVVEGLDAESLAHLLQVLR